MRDDNKNYPMNNSCLCRSIFVSFFLSLFLTLSLSLSLFLSLSLSLSLFIYISVHLSLTTAIRYSPAGNITKKRKAITDDDRQPFRQQICVATSSSSVTNSVESENIFYLNVVIFQSMYDYRHVFHIAGYRC